MINKIFTIFITGMLVVVGTQVPSIVENGIYKSVYAQVSDKTPTKRLVRVGYKESFLNRHDDITVILDTKTGQEYIYASNYNGGVAIIKIEDKKNDTGTSD